MLTLSLNMWHSLVPLKWTIIAWRIIQNKLPFDVNLQRIGFQLASKCCCCRVVSLTESVYHVFAQSSTARRLWRVMEAKLNVHSSSNLISLKLNE